MCDGYTVAGGTQQPKHKGGIIAEEHIGRYLQFIENAKELLRLPQLAPDKDIARDRESRVESRSDSDTEPACSEGDSGCVARTERMQDLEAKSRTGRGLSRRSAYSSENSRRIVLPLLERVGFGYAVKAGLKLVTTPYVMVVQHDQQLVRSFDLSAVLRVMHTHSDRVKYIGLTSVSTQTYERFAPSKFGIQVRSTREFGGVPLLPLIFFYDKPHIVSTQHYREVVLGDDSVVQKGDFIEETYGVRMRRKIMRSGLAAHQEYGTFQLDERDEQGTPLIFVAHVNGRAFLSAEQRKALGWPEKGHYTLLKKGRCLNAKAANPLLGVSATSEKSEDLECSKDIETQFDDLTVSVTTKVDDDVCFVVRARDDQHT